MNSQTTDIIHSESDFTSSDGTRLYQQWWRPAGDEKAIFIIVHGYAEHSARYQHVAEFLAGNGYSVGALDLRGHGKSEGDRCWVKTFDEYLDDLGSFLSQVKENEIQKPVFLLGHSMGGGVVALYALTRPLDVKGVLLSAALLQADEDLAPLLQQVSGILGKILPRMRTILLDSSLLSHDPEVGKAYDNDPLVDRNKFYARTAAELLRTIKRIQARMEDLKHPLLILHGADDTLSSPKGSQLLYDRSQSEDKTLKMYEGFYHEIMNEVEKERVLQDILAWVEARR